MTNLADMKPITVNVDAVPKSVDFYKYLLVGHKNGSIAEYDINRNEKEVIMHSHSDGESWGLTIIPG